MSVLDQNRGSFVYEILYAPEVEKDIGRLSAFRQKEILDRIEKQLSHLPTFSTRNKKLIKGIKPPWTEKDGFWQLRIGEYRIFYDVNEENMQVVIRAIRHKPPHKTTEEVI